VLQQQLAAARKDLAKVPALHATAKAATEHALQLEQQLQESVQHNAMLQQQVSEMRAAQQREREQAAVLAGNGSAMAQQLAEAQREAAELRQVCISAVFFACLSAPSCYVCWQVVVAGFAVVLRVGSVVLVCGVPRQQHQECLQATAARWRSSWLRHNGKPRNCGRCVGAFFGQVPALVSAFFGFYVCQQVVAGLAVVSGHNKVVCRGAF
jgi:hypothetical protein